MSSVGVLVVGHGNTASGLLNAARKIAAPGTLEQIVALDAGVGDSADFQARMRDALASVDQGGGVLMLVDLLGASPCQCGLREGAGRNVVALSGLNLAMLLKLSSLDLASGVYCLAEACARSAQKSVHVTPQDSSP